MKALSIRKLFFIIVALVVVLTGGGLAYALTVHHLPDTGLSQYDRSFKTWTVTNQSDFQAGVLNNVDITSSPGDVKIATSSNWLDGYAYRKSMSISAAENTYLNSGGTITTDGAYTIHTFTGGGTFTAGKAGNAEVLVVGGGGGAGRGGTNIGRNAGGGGAGGLVYIESYSVSTGDYTVVIGTGGAGSTAFGSKGSNGNPSSFGASLIAYGGGGGGSRDSRTGANGGSGGGGCRYDNTVNAGGSSTQPISNGGYANSGFGNSGSQGSNAGGGGGGGADGAGGQTAGGMGRVYWGVEYARGGNSESNGASGGANTGNGGNARPANSNAAGGAGGSGIVIVRCLTADFVNDNSQTDYQMQLTVSNSGGASSGSTVYLNGASLDWPSDIRFTDGSGTGLVDYWIEESDANVATIWVEFNFIPSYPGSGLFYIYYGKVDAADASNGENTFIFFDDFSGDLSKWNTHVSYGTVGINTDSGYPAPCLEVGGGVTSGNYGFTAVGTDASYSTFQDGIIEADIYPATDALPEIIFRGVYASNTGYKGRWDCRTGTETPWMIYPYSGWTGFGTAVTRFGLANQWQKAKLVVSGSTFSIYNNGVLLSIETDATYAGPGEIGVANHYGSYVLVDNIRVRKYASPEPTWGTWGMEETPSFSMTDSTIASDMFDIGQAGARCDLLSRDESLPAGTGITFEVRASDTPFGKSALTPAWQDASAIPAVFGQYQQWRATLSTEDGGVTPVLHEVRVLYSW